MARPPHDATSLLARYARTHRDPRNIAMQVLGIPLMVFALGLAMSHPSLLMLDTPLGTVVLTPAVMLWLLSTLWYLSRGLPGLGMAVSAANGALLCTAMLLHSEAEDHSLTWALGAFTLGCLCRHAGQYYEGRKPSLWPGINRLLTAPMFAVAEGLFALGWLCGLKADIERLAGPTRLRNLAMPTG